MRVKLLTANYAEVHGGGLVSSLGLGWSETGPGPTQMAIVAFIELEWGETNQNRQIVFTVEDLDGQPFLVPTPTGDQPFQIAAHFDLGRPPGGVRRLQVPFAVNLQPIQFRPGQGYVLKVAIDGTEYDQAYFTVRAAPPQPQRPA